jgi:hypothetical protein
LLFLLLFLHYYFLSFFCHFPTLCALCEKQQCKRPTH